MGRSWHNTTEQISICGDVSDFYSEEGEGEESVTGLGS
jgi:hypothetical protein